MPQDLAQERLFFDGHGDAWPLYLALRQAIAQRLPQTAIQVKKTQISLVDHRLYGAVSFLPVRKAAQRPPVWLTLTLGLPARLDSPRVDGATEPYPGRWTHHLTLSRPSDIDPELLCWLEEAAAFARSKR